MKQTKKIFKFQNEGDVYAFMDVMREASLHTIRGVVADSIRFNRDDECLQHLSKWEYFIENAMDWWDSYNEWHTVDIEDRQSLDMLINVLAKHSQKLWMEVKTNSKTPIWEYEW